MIFFLTMVLHRSVAWQCATASSSWMARAASTEEKRERTDRRCCRGSRNERSKAQHESWTRRSKEGRERSHLGKLSSSENDLVVEINLPSTVDRDRLGKVGMSGDAVDFLGEEEGARASISRWFVDKADGNEVSWRETYLNRDSAGVSALEAGLKVDCRSFREVGSLESKERKMKGERTRNEEWVRKGGEEGTGERSTHDERPRMSVVTGMSSESCFRDLGLLHRVDALASERVEGEVL